jgi:hypothetical protein
LRYDRLPEEALAAERSWVEAQHSQQIEGAHERHDQEVAAFRDELDRFNS